MGKIAIVTKVKPNPYNLGGPSGLLWEIMEYLRTKYQVDCYDVSNAKGKYREILQRYGFYAGRYRRDLSCYDSVLVYPEDLIFYIKRDVWHKCIVLGPDSPNWRDARIYRRATGIRKLLKCFMCCKSRHNEQNVLRKVRGYVVVGKTDRAWMQRRNPLYKDKVYFLRHPLLSQVIQREIIVPTMVYKKRFVFSGNIPKIYNQLFLDKMIERLEILYNRDKKNKISFIIVGKGNTWLARILKNKAFAEVERKDWIDDYNEVCTIGRDVHCIVLSTGAGTKNRTLTALANGLEVISTAIGIENILFSGIEGLFIAENPIAFADKIYEVNTLKNTHKYWNELVASRQLLRKKTTKEFCVCLERIFHET